jgi:preprotein translocase subunit SecE
MARQTRAQRRARRQAQQESANVTQRARQRQAQIRPTQPVKTQTGQRRGPGTGSRRFIQESWGELKKVEWPTQAQVIQGTVVVLLACLIVGIYLYAADQVFKRLVEHIFLR